MRTLRFCTLWALALAACGTPPAPGPPPEGSSPPVERAASCPPVARFGNAWFHLGDLDQAKSCTVYLEQDECVLAIFDDCTARDAGRRQWIGDLGPDGLVSMRASSGNGQLVPREGCVGELSEGPPAHVDLQCGNQETPHLGMVLEAVEDPASTFGDLEPAFVVVDVDVGVGMLDNDFFSDMILVDQNGARELWAIINGLDGQWFSGIHFLTTPGYRRIQDPVLIPQARFALRRGDEMIVVAAEGLYSVDVPARQLRASVVDPRSGPLDRQAAALSSDGSKVFVASQDPTDWFRSVIRSYDANTLEPLTDPINIDFSIDAMVALPTSTAGPAVAMFGRSESLQRGIGLLLDADLEEIRRDVGPIAPEAALLTPAGNRVGVVSGNIYAEYDWTNAEEPYARIIGVPYFTHMIGLAYDVARNRVYVGGARMSNESELLRQRDGMITYIDLDTRTAKQEPVGFDISFTKALYDDQNDSVLLGFPRVAHLETINLR